MSPASARRSLLVVPPQAALATLLMATLLLWAMAGQLAFAPPPAAGEEPSTMQSFLRKPGGGVPVLVGVLAGCGLLGALLFGNLATRWHRPLRWLTRWGPALGPLALVWLFLLAPAIGHGLVGGGWLPPEDARTVWDNLGIGVVEWTIALLICWWGLRGPRRLRGLGLVLPQPATTLLGAPLLLVLVFPLLMTSGVVGAAVYNAYGQVIPTDSNAEVLAKASIQLYIAVALFLVVLIPLGEELVFRGVLLGSLLEGLDEAWAVAIQAAIFAAVHPLRAYPQTFVVGLLAGWLRVRSGSLLPPIAFHAALNGLNAILALTAPESS